MPFLTTRMDIKDLDNYQLVLLTLLISFVTSIATGIVTVSLLQSAPIQISSAINKVVERTIEKVVPGDTKTEVQTVVLKEDDLVAEALAAGYAGVAKIITITPAAGEAPATSEIILLGVLIDSKGTVVVPGLYKKDSSTYIEISNNKYDAATVKYDKVADLSLLAVVPRDKETKALDTLGYLSTSTAARAGQTALVVGSGKFIKTLINDIKLPEKPTETAIGSVLMLSDEVPKKMYGAPILSIDGKVIGIVTLDGSGSSLMLGADNINAATGRAVEQKAL
jgi:hypothetical protein